MAKRLKDDDHDRRVSECLNPTFSMLKILIYALQCSSLLGGISYAVTKWINFPQNLYFEIESSLAEEYSMQICVSALMLTSMTERGRKKQIDMMQLGKTLKQ